jgi:hypothetical protein
LWPIPALVAPLRWIGLGHGEAAPMPDDVLVPAPHLGPEDLQPMPGLGPGDLEPVDLWALYDAVDRIAPERLHAAAESSGRWLDLKSHVYAWLHRLSGTDVVTATQISTGTGGGRIGTLGAVIGFCLSGLGAGTVCVVTGVIELPPDGLLPPPQSVPVTNKASQPALTPEPRPSPSREPKRPLPPAATPAPTPQREGETGPARFEPRREKRRDRQSAATTGDPAVAHETAEPLPVEASAPAEFTFEEPAPSQPQSNPRAAVPETGGGEFAP